MLNCVIDTCTLVLGCARNIRLARVVPKSKHDKNLQLVNNINNKTDNKILSNPALYRSRERLLQKFSTAEKNPKGSETIKIGKDCQHTWKDLSLTTSRELIVPCMAAITEMPVY